VTLPFALLATLAAAAALLAARILGPWGPRARFRRDAASALASLAPRGPAAPIAEADLAPLPPPVQRYLRRAGVVGRPPVRALTARFGGRLRGQASDPWMTVEAEQVETFDPPARLFYLRAWRAGVPVVAYHRFVGPSATFQVRLLGAFTLVDASGPEMDRSETVTLLNDMCLLAPATLLSPALRWEPVDERRARVAFQNGGQAVRAELRFDEAGDLVDFASDDRSRASPDGRTFERLRWTTPAEGHRSYGPWRLPAIAEARWHPPEGAYAYARFELLELDTDPRR
jgi:hypothetical protein